MVKSPTASELDDYSEYKRLRKVYRDLRNKAIASSVDAAIMVPAPVKVAPVIPPAALISSGRASSFVASPVVSQLIISGKAQDDESTDFSGHISGESPAIANEGHARVVASQYTALSSSPDIPAPPVRYDPPRSDLLWSHTPPGSGGTASIASTSRSYQPTTEVAPWIDYEPSTTTFSTTEDLATTKLSTIRGHATSDQLDHTELGTNKSKSGLSDKRDRDGLGSCVHNT